MADAGEEGLYIGVVKKKSVKDPTKYLVECAEAFEVHEVDARLSEDIKPPSVAIGDTIRFTLDEETPEITWAENVSEKKKRKAEKVAEEEAPKEEAVPEEEYIGTVTKQSVKQPNLYIVDCPVVTEWYKTEARLPEKLWPADLELGGIIRFRIKETSQGKPLISWCEVEDEKEKKRKKAAEKEKAKKEKAEAAEEPAAKKPKVEKGKGKGSDEGPTAEIRMDDPEAAIAAWELDGTKLGGSQITVVMHPSCNNGMSFKVSGFGERTHWMDLKDHFLQAGGVAFCKMSSEDKGKGKGKEGSKSAIGQVTFHDAETATAALSLYGTTCEGAELRVELDGRAEDGNVVKVFGLPGGFLRKLLKKHFEDAGFEVAKCKVDDFQQKNWW